MNAIQRFFQAGILEASWAERIGWTLLHSLWQIVLIAGVYALVSAMLRKHSARARYLCGCVALMAMICVPVGSYLLMPGGSGSGARQAEVAPVGVEFTEPVPAAFPVPDAAPPMVEAAADPPAILPTQETVSASVDAAESTPVAILSAATLRPWMPWATAVWLLGVCFLSLRPILGWLHIRRLQRHGLSPLSDAMRQEAKRLAHRLGVTRAVQFVQSTLVEVPTVVGSLRPFVLLPASAVSGLSVAEIEMILAHELAHIRRHDYLVNLAQTVLEALLFFHPAMWWVSRQVRKERENCCDDIAVAVSGNREHYVQALTRLEEQRAASSVAVLAATGGSLLDRVRRLLGQPCAEFGYRSATAWLAGLAAVGFVSLALATGDAPQKGSGEVSAEDVEDRERESDRESVLAYARALAAGDYKTLEQTWKFQDDLDRRFAHQMAGMFARAEKMTVELVSMQPMGDDSLFACFLMRNGPEPSGSDAVPSFTTFHRKDGRWRCAPPQNLRTMINARTMGAEQLGRRAITRQMIAARFNPSHMTKRMAHTAAQRDAFARLARPPYKLDHFGRIAEQMTASLAKMEKKETSWKDLWHLMLEELGEDALPHPGDFYLRVHLEAAKGDPHARGIPFADGSPDILAEPFPCLTEDHVLRAGVSKGPDGATSQVDITLTRGGAKILAAVTRESIGRRLAILIDDKVVTAPVIRTALSGGKAVITGNFSRKEAEAIAEKLNAYHKKAEEFLKTMDKKEDAFDPAPGGQAAVNNLSAGLIHLRNNHPEMARFAEDVLHAVSYVNGVIRVSLTYESNYQSGTKSKPAGPKDAKKPWCRIAIKIRPVDTEPSQLETSLIDAGREIRWDGKSAARSYRFEGSQLVAAVSVETGSDALRKDANRIIDRELSTLIAEADKTEGSTGKARPVGSAGLEFLDGIPEFRELNLKMSEAKLREAIHRHSLSHSLAATRDNSGEYHLYTRSGENVIVMFRDGECAGIQRMRPDRDTAEKLFVAQKEGSDSDEARPDGGLPQDDELRQRFLAVEEFARLPMTEQEKRLPEFYRGAAINPGSTMGLSSYPHHILKRDQKGALPGDGNMERWAQQLAEAASQMSAEQVADQLKDRMWLMIATQARSLQILRNHPDATAAETEANRQTLQRVKAWLASAPRSVRLETAIPEPISPDSHLEITGIPKLLPEPLESPTFLVPEETKLLSRGKKVTSSSDDPIFGKLDQITDGKKTFDHGFFVELEPGRQWVQIDLGQSVVVDAVWVWHCYFPARSYHDVVIQVSEDPEFKTGVTTVYNNDYDNSSKLGLGQDRPYVESRFGLLVDGRGVRGRYVRLYSRGTTWTDLNGYTEVEVFGREVEKEADREVPPMPFDELKVLMRCSWWGNLRRELTIRGDGGAVYAMVSPGDESTYRAGFHLSDGQREALVRALTATRWLADPPEKTMADDAVEYELVLNREGQTKRAEFMVQRKPPYHALEMFLNCLDGQEQLFHSLTASTAGHRLNAARDIQNDLSARMKRSGHTPDAHLKDLDYTRFVPVLIPWLKDRKHHGTDEMAAAIDLVGYLKLAEQREAVEALMGLHTYSNWNCVCECLVRLGDPRSIPVLKERALKPGAAAACWALIRMGESAQEAICEVLGIPPTPNNNPAYKMVRVYLDHFHELPESVAPRIVDAIRAARLGQDGHPISEYADRLLRLFEGGKPVRDLQVTISPEHPEYASGEPVLVKWKIENTGNQARTILWHPLHYSPVVFSFMEAGGTEWIRADLRRSLINKKPSPPEPLVLQPGESHEASIDLRHFLPEGTSTWVIAGYYWPRAKEAAIPAEFLNDPKFAGAVLDRIGSGVARIVVLPRPRTAEEKKREAERLEREAERSHREEQEARDRAILEQELKR